MVHFNFNEASVEGAEIESLENILPLLQQNPDIIIRIVGHTDNIGKEEANIRLSFKRAQNVANYLLQTGISADRLVVEGRGAFNPVVPNSSSVNQAKNRRVEIRPEYHQ